MTQNLIVKQTCTLSNVSENSCQTGPYELSALYKIQIYKKIPFMEFHSGHNWMTKTLITDMCKKSLSNLFETIVKLVHIDCQICLK